jgi:hypothetical protein
VKTRTSSIALLAACAIAILLSPCSAGAQAPGTIGFRAPAGRLEAEPGSGWKTAIVISNRGTTPMRLTPHIQLPDNWRPLLAPDAFEVPPGETNLLMLNAVVPAGTIAGTYPIIVELVSHRGQMMRRDTLNVAVLARRALRVSGEAGPRYARVDTAVTVDFVVRNEGNVPMTVDLRARAVDATATVRDSARLSISPGDVRYVAVVVGPKRGVGGIQLVELHARAVGVAANYTGAFEVLRVAETTSSRMVLPLNVRMRAYTVPGSDTRSGTRSAAVTPAEISGSIVGRSDTFNLLVRRPGAVGAFFGERDEYRLRWAGTYGRIIAGDIVPNEGPGGGPIRESYEMLSGYDVTARLGRFTANTYAGRDRLFATDATERGASLAVRALGSLSIGVGALQRTGVDSGDGGGGGRAWRAVTSVGGSSFGSPLLRGEISGGKGGISAYGVRAQRRFSRGWFDVSAADVGTAYPARERGSSRMSASAGARLSKLLSLRAWAGQYEMDTLASRLFAFRSNSYSAGFTFGPLSTDVRQEEREAFIEGISYSSREESVRATIGRAFRRMTLHTGVETGRSHELNGVVATTPFYRVSGSAYLHGNARGSGGVSLEYYSRTGEGIATNQQLTGTVTTSARLLPGMRVELIGSVFQVLFPTVASYSTVNARLEQALGKTGQTVALRARTFATTSATTIPERTTFFLEYGLPIGIPLPGLGPRQVRARVVEAASGDVVPGALVRMGTFVAITDRDGKVRFAPEAALNALTVERPNASSPLVVDAPELAAARSTGRREVTISVGEGARVRGRVTRYDRVTHDSVTPVGGIANVMVTLSRGDDTVNVVTQEDGAFDFRQLAPGSWTIAVSGGRIPPTYGFERSSATVVVEAGRSAMIEFRVMSRAADAALEDGGALTLPPRPTPKPTSRPR